MGRRGPAPTPTALLRLRDSWRAKINPNEPQPEVGAPPRPTWLIGDAAEIWDQLVEQLGPLGLLTKIDGGALGRYCDLFARWKKAAAFIEKHGDAYNIKDRDGQVKCVMPFPQVGTYHRLAALLVKMEQEFGLTPASRSRIQVDGVVATPENKKSRFFPNGPAIKAG